MRQSTFAKAISRRRMLPLAGHEFNIHSQQTSDDRLLGSDESLNLLSYFVCTSSTVSVKLSRLDGHVCFRFRWMTAISADSSNFLSTSVVC